MSGLSPVARQVVQQFGIDYTPDEPIGGWWGMSRRSVFVLDRDGVIRYAWVTDNTQVSPDIEEVFEAVAAVTSR